MRICLQTRILPRPYLCVSFHVDPVISGSCHYSRVHCPKQCTALDMGSFRQQWFKTAATVFVVHCILGEDCQQTFSCLPPVVSLILTRNKPNIPDRQTCLCRKCWSFIFGQADLWNPPSRITWSQSDVDEVVDKEAINNDVVEDNNFVIEQKRSGQRDKILDFPKADLVKVS